ncbi:MAG: hypothetical protein SFV15_02905 [Polyangiaceae bacterium]|nr:hypothetical protein [Polyangiaceae bacterium]
MPYALGVYLATTLSFLVFAAPETLSAHTPYNHFALLAEAWLKGNWALSGAPPDYAGRNDFAWFAGQWYVVFPPFPAVILLPFVWLFGTAERLADGHVFLWLAGLAPAYLYCALEKMRELGLCQRSRVENMLLSLTFAWGTVYFFTAVQGTVWFAAHVVGSALSAGYFYCALGAARPLLSGILLGLGFLTRTPLVFAFPLFLFEAYRVSLEPGRGLIRSAFGKRLAWFLAPLALSVAIALLYNRERFGHALSFGYEYLQIAWQARIQRHGLFGYHYLARNLGVVLTSLPYWTGQAEAPFQINGHGLALWVTTPIYVWAFLGRGRAKLRRALWLTVLCVALPSLLYQNTGWVQFGYRFSNDYAVFLFGLLALFRPRLGRVFWSLALFGVLLNALGARTFGRAQFAAYYDIERTQTRLYQAD